MRFKQLAVAVIALLGVSTATFGAPAIDFTSWGSNSTFNTNQLDTATVSGVGIAGFVWSPNTTSFSTTQGYLWLRNDTANGGDHGFGYCNSGESCGAVGTTGSGDYNELSNETSGKTEIIRLTKPTGDNWSNIFVSSMDTGGTNNNETGTLYWSNSATPNLSTLTGITFSHAQLGGGNEGSIWSLLAGHGFDPTANYLFFRAGSFNSSGTALNGTNNDYLVWGVNVVAVPEPEIYAMMGLGLALMAFVARRRSPVWSPS